MPALPGELIPGNHNVVFLGKVAGQSCFAKLGVAVVELVVIWNVRSTGREWGQCLPPIGSIGDAGHGVQIGFNHHIGLYFRVIGTASRAVPLDFKGIKVIGGRRCVARGEIEGSGSAACDHQANQNESDAYFHAERMALLRRVQSVIFDQTGTFRMDR